MHTPPAGAWFANVRLTHKLCASAVLFVAAIALAFAAGGAHGSERPALLAAAALLAGIAAALVAIMVRGVRNAVTRIVARIDTINAAALGQIQRGMKAVADGDLTCHLTAQTSVAAQFAGDEFGDVQRGIERVRDGYLKMYDSYNENVAMLRQLVGELQNTARTVGGTALSLTTTSADAGRVTGEIALAINEVAAGAERQVSMLSEARDATSEAALSATRSAEHAAHAAQATQHAHAVTVEGIRASERASEAMNEVRQATEQVATTIHQLSAKSAEIGKIVDVMSGIADQTNLLALNAAIEAARAGEHGRGFAVVSTEVRKLAEQSAAAAGEIAELVASVQAEAERAVQAVTSGTALTDEGTRRVSETLEAFAVIGQAVDDANGRVGSIADAVAVVAAASGRVEQAVGDVAAVSEQNSASSQEVSASSQETTASTQQIAGSAQELSDASRALNELVGHFRLTAAG